MPLPAGSMAVRADIRHRGGMDASLDYIKHVADAYLLPTGLRLLVAALLFFTGRAIARAVMRMFDRAMDRSKVDVSLRKFLTDVVYAILLVAVIIASLDTVGIKTTAVLAVLGAAGLAIGLALQGSLSNFAAGVMLIVLRPYKVGDVVVIGKYLGRVDAIKVFHTIVITGDHREVTIPNGQIIGAPIENLTVLGRRRVDFLITVPDAVHLLAVKRILEGLANTDERVSPTPPAAIEVAEVTDTGFKLHFRPWTTTEHYDGVVADVMTHLMKDMDAAKLKFTVALQATVV
jgi:small conductance mechanosensitive channel